MGHLPESKTVTLDELESIVADNGYRMLVDKKNEVVLLADANVDDSVTPQQAAKGEISGSGATLWRRNLLTDYNPNLSGTQAIDTFREMRNDGVVRSTLRVAKTPILSARWFMQPASDDPFDEWLADFVWKCLNNYMTISWPQFLTETLFMLDYGVYSFEKVFEFRDVPGPTGTPENLLVWKKFAPRHPYEISEFIYDDEGGPESIMITTDEEDVELPIWKALIFTFEKEAGDLWGFSVLRSAYKHWFFKEQLYKIDAIQKERHGIGIPVIKLPPNFSPDDKIAAENIGRNLRTNERAHVVLPPGWEVYFLKLEGQRVDALASAEHHANKLFDNVLANFLQTNVSTGEAEIQEHVFTRSVRFTAEIIRDVLNHYAIPQLVRFNFTEEETPNGLPQLRVRRLGDERDWRTLSFALRNLVGAKIIRPDDKLEAWAREEIDAPFADLATMRNIDDDGDSTGIGDEEEDETLKKPTEGGTPRTPDMQPNLPRAVRPGVGSQRTGADRSGG